MACTKTTVDYRVGYPAKDKQGNAIKKPEGVEVRVQNPGTDVEVPIAVVEMPNTIVTIETKGWADGQYILVFYPFTYSVHCPGETVRGCCRNYGPPAANKELVIDRAPPGAPPDPIELVSDGCGPCHMTVTKV